MLFFVVVARVAIKPSTEFISYELLIRLMRGNCRRHCNTIYTRKATCKHSVSPCLVMQLQCEFLPTPISLRNDEIIDECSSFSANLFSVRVLGAFLLCIPQGHAGHLQSEASAHGTLREEPGTAWTPIIVQSQVLGAKAGATFESIDVRAQRVSVGDEVMMMMTGRNLSSCLRLLIESSWGLFLSSSTLQR